MKTSKISVFVLVLSVMFSATILVPRPAAAVLADCDDIKQAIGGNWMTLQTELRDVLDGTDDNQLSNTNNSDSVAGNGGLALPQWVAVVDRDGKVCAVFFSGDDRADQWPGSRVISMQKAYTANSFSLDGLPLATANLWAATQPGQSLFGLQFSNPVDPSQAYKGQRNVNPDHFGNGTKDPAVGERVGGVNVFGGGLGLYNSQGIIGGIGTSGNTSCTDHVITWKLRAALGLDNTPAAPFNLDKIIFDVSDDGHGNPESASGFGHPTCLNNPAPGTPGTVFP